MNKHVICTRNFTVVQNFTLGIATKLIIDFTPSIKTQIYSLIYLYGYYTHLIASKLIRFFLSTNHKVKRKQHLFISQYRKDKYIALVVPLEDHARILFSFFGDVDTDRKKAYASPVHYHFQS